MYRISSNFIYAFILTRSALRLSHIIFCTFVPELWPLLYSKISFPLNISRTNGQILTTLYKTIYSDKIYVGIVSCHFSHICTSVMALDLRQNSVSVQYLENKRTEFHQILYMSADLTKGSFGHFSSFCVIKISKTSKFSRFCMFLL